GYLKFPGPFPVASIRLKYVARPQAAERFVPREGDGAEPRSGAEGAGSGGIAIPEPPDPDGSGPADGPGAPGTPSEPAGWQGELDLVPLPGEAGDAEPDAAAAETAAGEGPEADAERPSPPRPSDSGAGRGSDWG
ncbi:MAG: hypothetical protein OXP75_16165, partial [Rhodospirillales bacterium]|nr:hypothetical protein [Rhodospirillales bacterium]